MDFDRNRMGVPWVLIDQSDRSRGNIEKKWDGRHTFISEESEARFVHLEQRERLYDSPAILYPGSCTRHRCIAACFRVDTEKQVLWYPHTANII